MFTQPKCSCCIEKEQERNHKNNQSHNHNHDHNHDHEIENISIFKLFLPAIISFILLIAAIIMDYLKISFFTSTFRLAWYIVAYFPVGFPVFKEMLEEFKNKDFFNEFSLMFLASVGAFYIGQYPEGVAVMLFYSVGENFQTLAVARAKSNINALLDQRPDEATILDGGEQKTVKAKEVSVGAIVQLKPGEKLALDGELVSEESVFNTSALTGESVPQNKKKGDIVLAGMINLNQLSVMKVTVPYSDSKLSRILNMIQNSGKQKAKTELFIRKFARYYTPTVFFIALMVFVFPYFLLADYEYKTWLYRSLIFLVISCPCALVISIPLGYFGGIGLASRNGILIKGSNHLDTLTQLENIVFDKTGTLTQGNFKVQKFQTENEADKAELLDMINLAEANSTHPIALAIQEYAGKKADISLITTMEDIPGKGIRAEIRGKEILVGNVKLMEQYSIAYNKELKEIVNTLVLVAVDGKFAGYMEIADQLKPQVKEHIEELQKLGIHTIMLSGDKDTIVQKTAKDIGIERAYGDLLPEDKVTEVEKIKKIAVGKTAFVGDGFNDAPVLAVSDVGMAMGGLGSDAAIEVADIIIQDDNTEKIPKAIKIGKATRKIVIQNITLAFGVKLLVMILGVFGDANLLEAVFADVGVALLAILNAVRLQNMKIS